MNPVLRGSAAHVFVDHLDSPELSESDEHHLARVLRIRPTDPVTVADGSGRWSLARWRAGRLEVEEGPFGTDRGIAPPVGVLTIGCALPKGDRPELIVQKATELGIDRIVFFEAVRSVVRWDERKRAGQLDRLRRVAREASMQSRRLALPVIDVLTWADAVRMDAVAVAEPGGRRRWWDVGAPPVRTVLVGPEGGFTGDELAAVTDRVALGASILRVETAAIAAAVLLGSMREAADVDDRS